jgi:hypothetical protein
MAGGGSGVQQASFTPELAAVKQAAKLSSTELLEEVGTLQKSLELVAAELKHYEGKRSGTAPPESDIHAYAAHVAGERFVQVMRPFYDGASPQVEELVRATSEMGNAQGRMKSYFSEEAKASIDELYSRWATFLSQIDMAVNNANEDRRKGR